MVDNRRMPPQRGTIADVVRSLLDSRYQDTARVVLDAIARSTNSGLIARRLDELDAEARRLAEAGQRLRPDNPMLRAVLADVRDELQAAARLIDGAAEAIERTGIDASGTIQRQLALPGMTDAQLEAIGIRWIAPDPEAIRQLVDYVDSAAWSQTLSQYPDEVVSVIRNQAIRGMAEGWNPLKTAREIARTTGALPQSQANTLMRTLQLTSYRDSTAVHQQANIDLAEQIIRIGTRDLRMCLSCVAQHGDVIWDSRRDAGAPVPRVNDHHNGRCTSVMRVVGRPVSVQSGADWFAGLSRADRVALAGDANLSALDAGAVSLRDFVHDYTDPVFGEMQREASLRGILGAGAERYYRRNQS